MTEKNIFFKPVPFMEHFNPIVEQKKIFKKGQFTEKLKKILI